MRFAHPIRWNPEQRADDQGDQDGKNASPQQADCSPGDDAAGDEEDQSY